jgi:metal-dependent hydrolase (beta-lactamase superfamily II)
MIGLNCPVYHPDDYEFPKLPALASKIVDKSISLKENIHIIMTDGVYRGKDTSQEIKEISLVIDDTLFIGCCHSGFKKIMDEVRKFAKIKKVVGGFHNFNESDQEMQRSAKLLKSSGVSEVIVLHCSSHRFFMHLEKVGIEAKVGSVGHSFNF